MITVIVFGLPGSGKSYFAAHLATVLQAKYAGSDQIRKRRFPNPTYTPAEKEVVYTELLRKMEDAARAREHIVLDANFPTRAQRQRFSERAEALNSDVFFIEMRADETTIFDRISDPRPDSDADVDVYHSLKTRFEPMEEPHLELWSDQGPVEDLVDKAMKHIFATHEDT